MMHIETILAIVFMILINFSPTAESIKCWVCHSDSDPKCADPFDNTTLPIKDCREVKRSHLFEIDVFNRPTHQLKTATMCRKIRQKIHGNWRTIRDCAFLGAPGEGTGNEHNCLYKKGTYDVYLEYCTCDSKDGCNGAVTIMPNINQLSLFIILSILILTNWINNLT